MSGGLTVLADTPRFQRKMRRPRHDFNVRHMPFCIAPFAIAPVLPGETLKDGNLQSRAVVDPIKNPLIGWWLEHYVFYVPHGAMLKAQSWQDMVLEPDRDMSGDLTVAASLKTIMLAMASAGRPSMVCTFHASPAARNHVPLSASRIAPRHSCTQSMPLPA